MQKITKGDIVEILEGAYTVFSGKSGFVLEDDQPWYLVEMPYSICWFHEDELRNMSPKSAEEAQLLS